MTAAYTLTFTLDHNARPSKRTQPQVGVREVVRHGNAQTIAAYIEKWLPANVGLSPRLMGVEISRDGILLGRVEHLPYLDMPAFKALVPAHCDGCPVWFTSVNDALGHLEGKEEDRAGWRRWRDRAGAY